MIRLLGVSHQEGVFGVFQGNYGRVQQVGPDQRDVLNTDQHVQVQCSPFLKFEAVEVSQDIAGRRSLGVAEQLLPPAIGISTRKVASGSLLQVVGHVERLQCGSRTNEGQGKVHSNGLMVTKSDEKPYWKAHWLLWSLYRIKYYLF